MDRLGLGVAKVRPRFRRRVCRKWGSVVGCFSREAVSGVRLGRRMGRCRLCWGTTFLHGVSNRYAS